MGRMGGLVRAFRARPRLLVAIILVGILMVVLPWSLAWPTRALIAWNSGIGLYLVLAFVMMLAGEEEENMRRRAATQDEGALTVLILTALAAIACLVAIAAELAGVRDMPAAQKLQHIGLVIATVLTAWFFVHTMFTLHYAHEYYQDPPGSRPALDFPGGEKSPDYLDFLYFASTIGVACATADVSITSRDIRRVALWHGVLAFFFNTTILALAINVGAGLLA
jgi:uncharacterized membrane protein